jgi:hypothetical protein
MIIYPDMTMCDQLAGLSPERKTGHKQHVIQSSFQQDQQILAGHAFLLFGFLKE